MKKTIFAFVLLTILTYSGATIRSQAQTTDTYFPYPVVPEEKSTLSERCNFLVYNFWERCNLKQSFSSLEKPQESDGRLDWIHALCHI